jgi:nucleoside-diphosphate-sugar epimerase
MSALGTAWSVEPFAPLYAPVDEAHPLIVKDCYGLSKEVDERTGEMFHRRTGMQVVALRFHWVARLEEARERAAALTADPRHEHWFRHLWGYIEVRDAAAACRLGIEANGLGFEPFNVVAADTLVDAPTEDVIRTYAPTVELRRPIPGTSSAFSTEKARRLLGWAPAHTWRS